MAKDIPPSDTKKTSANRSKYAGKNTRTKSKDKVHFLSTDKRKNKSNTDKSAVKGREDALPYTPHHARKQRKNSSSSFPYDHFVNRELSWLAFNKRVLEEASNCSNPLFERLRFLGITASNMDEFFMVRVAGLKAQVREEVTTRSIDGLTPQQQLTMISERVTVMIDEMQKVWREIKKDLSREDIHIIGPEDIDAKDKKWLGQKFKQDIFPILSPIAVDPAHPFPFIPNKGVAIALQFVDARANTFLDALIPLPPTLQRFIQLPENKDSKTLRYIPLEKLVLMHLETLFPKHFKLEEYAVFRVLRDSEIEVDDEAEDLVRTFESALKRRRRGSVIRLKIHSKVNEELLDLLTSQLHVQDHDVFKVKGLIGLDAINDLITDEKEHLIYPAFDARFPERIRDHGGDCFAAISNKDIVIHHPYESFDVVVKFLQQAASDPDVVAIKQTLYRTSKNSPIVEALIEAAEDGKSVTALVELKARFDEEANIQWARDMERAGVQVVFGFMDLKTHAKVSIVHRRENNTLKSYAHFGTGNYHPQTAKVYTDLSYFTCDKDLCQDAALLFNYMTGYAMPSNMKKLSIAPLHIRERLEELIDNEIEAAKSGKPAAIWIKCNSVLDSRMIEKLYEASQAGVDIDMIVRGICALKPGIKGISENIYVKSIVGRFLEHARIYCFANGHHLPSKHAKVFISSADLMTRNLDRRIETLERLRDNLDGCIGCGCLSLPKCALYNQGDRAAQRGTGPRYLMGDAAPLKQ